MNKPNKILVHHTGGSDKNPLADTSHHTAKDVRRWHKSLGWDDIGYHFFIEKKGKVVKGRDVKKNGAHCRGQNTKSIGVCLAGNFDATLPTKAQERSLRKLLEKLCDDHNISKKEIYPHRKFSNKTCYGKKLKDTWARDLLKKKTKVRKNKRTKKVVTLKNATIKQLVKELAKRF